MSIDLTGICTVTICSSSKFYATAEALAKEMTDAGLTVYTPRFDFNEELVTVTKADKAMLTREFLAKIDQADALYVIDQGGYTGRSVCIEIGYAYALSKPVIVSEPPAEDAVAALASDMIAVSGIVAAVRPVPASVR